LIALSYRGYELVSIKSFLQALSILSVIPFSLYLLGRYRRSGSLLFLQSNPSRIICCQLSSQSLHCLILVCPDHKQVIVDGDRVGGFACAPLDSKLGHRSLKLRQPEKIAAEISPSSTASTCFRQKRTFGPVGSARCSFRPLQE